MEVKRKPKTEAKLSGRKTKKITFIVHTSVCGLKKCIPVVLA